MQFSLARQLFLIFVLFAARRLGHFSCATVPPFELGERGQERGKYGGSEQELRRTVGTFFLQRKL